MSKNRMSESRKHLRDHSEIKTVLPTARWPDSTRRKLRTALNLNGRTLCNALGVSRYAWLQISRQKQALGFDSGSLRDVATVDPGCRMLNALFGSCDSSSVCLHSCSWPHTICTTQRNVHNQGMALRHQGTTRDTIRDNARQNENA